MPMRIKPLESAQARPDKATAFLAPEQNRDADVEFEPRRDVSFRDWKGMLDALQRYLETGAYMAFLELVTHMATIAPERRDELPLETVWAQINKYLERERKEKEWYTYAEVAEYLLTLFPEEVSILDLDDVAWKGMKEELERDRNLDWWRFGNMAKRMAMLFPDRRHEPGLDGEILKELLAQLERQRQAATWTFFIDTAVSVALLYPEHRDELHLDATAWKEMKRPLDNQRKSGERKKEFGEFAVALTILAAQDARITSDGRIQITPKKPTLAAEPTPLPARAR